MEGFSLPPDRRRRNSYGASRHPSLHRQDGCLLAGGLCRYGSGHRHRHGRGRRSLSQRCRRSPTTLSGAHARQAVSGGAAATPTAEERRRFREEARREVRHEVAERLLREADQCEQKGRQITGSDTAQGRRGNLQGRASRMRTLRSAPRKWITKRFRCATFPNPAPSSERRPIAWKLPSGRIRARGSTTLPLYWLRTSRHSVAITGMPEPSPCGAAGGVYPTRDLGRRSAPAFWRGGRGGAQAQEVGSGRRAGLRVVRAAPRPHRDGVRARDERPRGTGVPVRRVRLPAVPAEDCCPRAGRETGQVGCGAVCAARASDRVIRPASRSARTCGPVIANQTEPASSRAACLP